MGRCLQVTHVLKQNITGGGARDTLTAASGDTLNVPAFTQGTRAGLVDAWGGNSANACDFFLRSPNFADNTSGLRMSYDFNPTLSGADGNPQFMTGRNVIQPLYPSDTLIAEVLGTATNNVGMGYLSFYDDLPGCDMQLVTWGEVEPRIVNTLGIRVSVTAGATGDYGTALNFTSSDDRLIANTTYAILGAASQLPCTTLAMSGPETSNRFVGLPLHWDQRNSLDYFVYVAKQYGIPSIPTLNGSNKAQWSIKAADAATNIATACTIQLAELR
jgi:hypothetical protein